MSGCKNTDSGYATRTKKFLISVGVDIYVCNDEKGNERIENGTDEIEKFQNNGWVLSEIQTYRISNGEIFSHTLPGTPINIQRFNKRLITYWNNLQNFKNSHRLSFWTEDMREVPFHHDMITY